MAFVVVAYSPDGNPIGAFDTYKRAEYYIANETDESLADVDIDEVTYHGSE